MDDRFPKILERASFAGLVAALVYGLLATGAVRTQDFLVMQGLVLVATVLWAVRLLLDRGHRLLCPPAVWMVLSFVGYAWWQASRAALEYPASAELQRVLTYALVFVLVVNHMRRQENASLLVYVLAGVGTLVAGYAVYQFLAKSDHVWWYTRPASYAGRGSGVFICPNTLAGFLAILLPLATSVAMGGRTPVIARIGLVYAACVMLAGLGVSLSRGGWVAAGAGMAALLTLHFWYRQHVKRALFVLILLGVVTSVVASRSLVVKNRVRSTVASYHVGDAVELRLSLWRSAQRMWQDHFWWGVGPGHFDYRFPAYRETSAQARPVHAHNDYLNTLADWGTVGAAIILSTVAAVLFAGLQVLRYARRSPSDLERVKASDRWPVVAGAVSGLIAALAHAWVDFDMQIPGVATLVLVLMALVCSYVRFTSDRYWFRLNLPARVGLSAGLVALVGGLATSAVEAARETRYLNQAARETHQTPERREALRAALAVRPDNFEARFALAESCRQVSWQGDEGYETNALEAIAQYRLAAETNPFDPYNPSGIGMCLDWLGRHAEALPFHEAAQKLDPNNYYLSILRGWHHLQTAEYSEARRWFLRSLQQKHWPNPQARQFLSRVNRLIAEQESKAGGPRAAPTPASSAPRAQGP